MGFFFQNRLHASQPIGGDGETWTLDEPVLYFSTEYSAKIFAPQGFETDFASIPWLFRRLLPKSGEYNAAAVIHDFLYRCRPDVPQAVADGIFLEAMNTLGVPAWKKYALYGGVRCCGAFNKASTPCATCEGGAVESINLPMEG